MQLGITALVQPPKQGRLAGFQGLLLSRIRVWKNLFALVRRLPELHPPDAANPEQLCDAVLHLVVRRSGRGYDDFEHVIRATQAAQEGHAEAANQSVETLLLSAAQFSIKRSEEDCGAQA